MGAVSTRRLWWGRVLSGLAAVFLFVDATGKLLRLDPVVAGTLELGYPEGSVVPIGLVLMAGVLLYAVPRTAVAGALYLTAYLGGAVATHVRVGSPLWSHVLFPTYVAVLLWAGLVLRRPQLLSVLLGNVRAPRIFTHLWYAKEAEEAARFYASIFPDSRVDRVTPLPSDSPSGPAGSVEVVDFTLLGQRFQAITAGPHHEFNDAVSIVVPCDDQAELDRYWDALLAGGGRPQACGWLIDRFGLRWQIVPAILDELMRDADPERSKRVAEAMLGMVKLDIAALEAARRS
jgi:predicted 3-demethylubiquinone-9 3-methyltransferase (glyoxalase superfamily)